MRLVREEHHERLAARRLMKFGVRHESRYRNSVPRVIRRIAASIRR